VAVGVSPAAAWRTGRAFVLATAGERSAGLNGAPSMSASAVKNQSSRCRKLRSSPSPGSSPRKRRRSQGRCGCAPFLNWSLQRRTTADGAELATCPQGRRAGSGQAEVANARTDQAPAGSGWLWRSSAAARSHGEPPGLGLLAQLQPLGTRPAHMRAPARSPPLHPPRQTMAGLEQPR